MPTLKELRETTAGRAVVERVISRFGEGHVVGLEIEVAIKMPDSRLFNELVKHRGKGKPHSLKNYVRREGKKKNS